MSSVNVIPSAPELYPMNEITQINAEDFRLKKNSDLQTELKNEAGHYRQVAKKYKRSHSMAHISAVGLGSLSAGLSSATLATALTGFGIVDMNFTNFVLFVICIYLKKVSQLHSFGSVFQFHSFGLNDPFDSFGLVCNFVLIGPVSHFDLFEPVCHFHSFGPVLHFDLFGPVQHFDLF